MAFKLTIYIIYLLIVFSCSVGKISCRPSKESVIQQQVHLTMDLCDELDDIYNFDNIIVYRTPAGLYEPPIENGLVLKLRNYQDDDPDKFKDDVIDKSVGNILANFVFSHKIYKPLMTFTIKPWDYINDTKSIPNLGNILTNKNLAIVILNDIYNVELKEFVALSLGASLETKIVFLLIGHELANIFGSMRLEKLNQFFRWCWSKNILNAILLFQSENIKTNLSELKLQVYTYTPFPNPTNIIQLTGTPPRDYFKERTNDLMGYQFKTPIYPDMPCVFKCTDRKTGLKTITGISGHIYMEFVKKINATLVELPTDENPITKKNIYDLLITRKIDMYIHPSTFLMHNDYFCSYPITNTNCCVVVPVKPEIFEGLYIPFTLNLNMWAALCVIFIGFQIVTILINYQIYGQWRQWQSFSTTLQGLLSMPISHITINATRPIDITSLKGKLFVHLLLSLIGMLYCQLYIAGLSSLLSSTLYPKQIETLEDLRAANISIMLLDYVFNAFNRLNLIPSNFTHHLKIADPNTVSHNVHTLNTAYAYVVYNEEWKVMQRLQRTLVKPRFRIVPQLCIPNIYLNFPMQFNSPFFYPLMEFVLRTQATGLEAKWRDMIFVEIQHSRAGKTTKLKDHKHPVSLTLEHLYYILYVYVVGIFLALIAFIWELTFGKIMKKN